MWDKIIGHETIKKTLINALVTDKAAHAYLFAGPKGLGKETMARTFAQAFFCQQGNGYPCGHCMTCKNIVNNNYPDIEIIEPMGTWIKIEQIRQIQKTNQFKSYNGLGRVFIIKEAESMRAEAANCLLKILEEPNPNTVFLLLAENPYALLPTVLSRCQKLSFRPIAPSKLTEWLISTGVDENRSKVISALSEGIPGKALQLLIEKDSDLRPKIVQTAEYIQQGDVVAVLKLAEDMAKNKENIAEELSMLAIWYRDMLVWSKTEKEKLLINADMVKDIKRQARELGRSKLQIDLANILETKKLIHTNVNLRLCLENLLLKLKKSA